MRTARSRIRQTDIRYGAAQLVTALLLLVPAALALLAWAVHVVGEGAWLQAIALSAFGIGLAWVYLRMIRAHVAFDAGNFSTSSVVQGAFTGNANDFIGFELDLTWHNWTLLRRSDLVRVRIPWLSSQGVPQPGDPVYDWLHEYFAPARVSTAPRVAKQAAALPRQRALSALGEALRVVDASAPRNQQLLQPDQDLELAVAAHAAAIHRYSDARADLERLLVELPAHSVCQQYVIQGLRQLGNAGSVGKLEVAFRSDTCRFFRGQIAEALAHLATSEHEPMIARLVEDEDPFVRRVVAEWYDATAAVVTDRPRR